VLTSNSQSTGGSISTTTIGEMICPSFSAPPPHQQLSSKQSTTDRSSAPPTVGDGGSSHSSARHEQPQHSESGQESDNRKWVSLAHATIARAKALVLPYKGKRLPTNVAAAVQQLKESCLKCHLMLHSAVGIELMDLHDARTSISPPFYHTMIDIPMGFKARPTKDSRKCFTVNALVIVSATSLLVIKG
jgi:hypothetical protein